MKEFLAIAVFTLVMLSGCGTIGSLTDPAILPEITLLPIPQSKGGDDVFASVTVPIPCDRLYCFVSGGAVASGYDGVSKPFSLTKTEAVEAQDGAWTWRLESSAGTQAEKLAVLATQRPGTTCHPLPGDILDSGAVFVMPPRTRNFDCALQRVHQLMKLLSSGAALPAVDVSVLLVPFGFNTRKLWQEESPEKIKLHYLHTLEASGDLDTIKVSGLIARELTHALSMVGAMPWGTLGDSQVPADRALEMQRAFTIEICARAAVEGDDARRTLYIEPKSTLPSPMKRDGPLGEYVNDVMVPADLQARRSMIRRYKELNQGSAEYDAGNRRHVAALFGLCREMATKRPAA